MPEWYDKPFIPPDDQPPSGPNYAAGLRKFFDQPKGERSSGTATVSDHSPAETPTGAARALIAWFAGGLAFQSVEKFSTDAYWSAAGYCVGAVVVAIIDYKLKAILAGSPRLTKSLNQVAGDARWWVAAAMLTLFIASISPYIEQRRWPYTPIEAHLAPAPAPAQSQSTPTIRPIPPTVDISGDLTILSNEEVRASAYVLAAQIDDYLNGYISKSGNINRDQSISDVERGTLKLRLDATYSKDFRIKFASDVLKVQTELRRRLKLEKDPPAIEFASGTLGYGDMSYAASHLVNLAKMLP